MFTLTVTKLADGKKCVVTGSDLLVVVDHLHASAGRHGFDVMTDPGSDDRGSVYRNGERVAEWEVSRS